MRAHLATSSSSNEEERQWCVHGITKLSYYLKLKPKHFQKNKHIHNSPISFLHCRFLLLLLIYLLRHQVSLYFSTHLFFESKGDLAIAKAEEKA